MLKALFSLGGSSQAAFDFEIPQESELCSSRVVLRNKFPGKRFKGQMSEVDFRRIERELEEAVNSGRARKPRRVLAAMKRRVMFSMVGIMLGFMVGFLGGFLGGVNGNVPILVLGIVFVLLFVFSLVTLILSASRIQSLSSGIADSVVEILNDEILPTKLRPQFPLLEFSIVSINQMGRICSVRVHQNKTPCSNNADNYVPIATAIAEPSPFISVEDRSAFHGLNPGASPEVEVKLTSV